MNPRFVELYEPKKTIDTEQETTNAYVDLAGSELVLLSHSRVSYIAKNTDGANAIKWKVLGSNDGTTYIEIMAEAEITAGNTDSHEEVNAVFKYYKVQIKSSIADTHGDVIVYGLAK